MTLDLLEAQVPEGVLSLAERYVQEGRVDQLREVDKNLWQARITGFEHLLEPEVLLRGNYVKAFSCECSRANKKIPCPHATALMLLLRKIRHQKLLKQESQSIPAIPYRDLIDMLPEARLRQFLKEWAERDPEVALAIRAEFFCLAPGGRHLDHLRKLFQPYLLEEGGLATEPASNLRALQVLIRHVLRQSETLLDSGAPAEAYHNLGYLLPLLVATPGFRNRTALTRQILQLVVKQRLKENLDPRSARFDFLLHSMRTLVDLGEEKLLSVVLLELQGYAGFPQAAQRIHDVTGEILRQPHPTLADPQALLLVHYQTLNQEAKKGQWLDELALPRLAPVVYSQLADTLLQSRDFEGALGLAEKGLANYPLFADLLRLCVKALWELHDFDRIPDLLMRLLTVHQLPEDLEMAITFLSPKRWEDFYRALLVDLEKQPSSFSRNVVLGEALCLTGDWDALTDLLIRSESPKLLQRFTERLLRQGPERVGPLFERFLSDYLGQHLGPPASRTVVSLLELLPQESGRGVRKQVLDFLKQRFPERLEPVSRLERNETVFP